MRTKGLAFIIPRRTEAEAGEKLARRIRPHKIHAVFFVAPDEANLVAVEGEARRLGLTNLKIKSVKAGYAVTIFFNTDQKRAADELANWIEPELVSRGTTTWYEFVFWDEANFIAFQAEAAGLGLPSRGPGRSWSIRELKCWVRRSSTSALEPPKEETADPAEAQS